MTSQHSPQEKLDGVGWHSSPLVSHAAAGLKVQDGRWLGAGAIWWRISAVRLRARGKNSQALCSAGLCAISVAAWCCTSSVSPGYSRAEEQWQTWSCRSSWSPQIRGAKEPEGPAGAQAGGAGWEENAHGERRARQAGAREA